MATVGSLAARDRGTTLAMLDTWGSDRLILGADCKDGMIAVSGWASVTDLGIDSFVASYLQAGFRRVVSTDIGRDGMLNGPAIDLYGHLMQSMHAQSLPMELIASGGIRSIADLEALEQAGLSGAIVGKALYEGLIDIEELGAWQAAKER